PTTSATGVRSLRWPPGVSGAWPREREMAVRILMGGLIILSLAAPGVAENVPPPDEVIRGLTEQEISALQQGLGMGRARAPALHGYPGPRHVLDLVQAGQLSLGPEQVRTAQHLFDRMAREAQRLGDLILREERSLEAEF